MVKNTNYEVPHVVFYSLLSLYPSKYSPKHLVPNTFNPCFSLKVRDQVPHPYKITDTIIVSNNVVFSKKPLKKLAAPGVTYAVLANLRGY
jgi:hypothetical protein